MCDNTETDKSINVIFKKSVLDLMWIIKSVDERDLRRFKKLIEMELKNRNSSKYGI